MIDKFDEDDIDEDEDFESQVMEVTCPHCHQALHVIVEPAGHPPLDEDEEIDDDSEL